MNFSGSLHRVAPINDMCQVSGLPKTPFLTSASSPTLTSSLCCLSAVCAESVSWSVYLHGSPRCDWPMLSFACVECRTSVVLLDVLLQGLPVGLCGVHRQHFWWVHNVSSWKETWQLTFWVTFSHWSSNHWLGTRYTLATEVSVKKYIFGLDVYSAYFGNYS